jgi:hypothetical protein
MATRKKITLSPSIDHANASGFVRFTLGDAERKAADAWHKAGNAEITSARFFYDTVLVAHGIAPADLRKPDGRARSNEEAAAYDFAQAAFFRARLGAACADAMADTKVAKDTVLSPTGLTATGERIKPQSKGALRTSYGGGKTWGVFLSRMEEIHATGAVKAKGKPTASSDMKYVADRLGAVVARLRKDVEKLDGSIEMETAKKLADVLTGIVTAYRIK